LKFPNAEVETQRKKNKEKRKKEKKVPACAKVINAQQILFIAFLLMFVIALLKKTTDEYLFFLFLPYFHSV